MKEDKMPIEFNRYNNYKKENPLDYKEYYIFYFDILGYKNLIEEKGEEFIIQCKFFIKEVIIGGYGEPIIIRNFSDNIIFAVESPNQQGLKIICSIASKIQSMMLFYFGILIRGSITKGKLVIDEKFLSGEGLIRAYELESKEAVMPRIILDADKLKEEEYYETSEHTIIDDEILKETNSTEFKKYKIINYFHFYNSKIMTKQNNDKTDIDLGRIRQLENQKYFIEKNIKKYEEYQKILEKWQYTKELFISRINEQKIESFIDINF